MGCVFSRSPSRATVSKSSNTVQVPDHISKEIDRIDRNADGRIDKDECQEYIDSHAQLWAMLSASCNIPTKRCREIARDTAYTMAKKRPDQSFRDLTDMELERAPTKDEFKQLFSKIHADPQYQLEFFHRTVFCAFDQDNNGFLDSQELDAFLDIFYDIKSSFAGDARLPHKQVLKRRVMQDLDSNGDGRLEFEELRPLISGGSKAITSEGHPSNKKRMKKKSTSVSSSSTAKGRPVLQSNKVKERKKKSSTRAEAIPEQVAYSA